MTLEPIPLEQDDLPARAAYQASCDARGVKPNWGKNGYQAQAERWRTVAAAVAHPKEPPVPEKKPQKPKKAVWQYSPDLHDIAIPMSQAILVIASLLSVPKEEMDRFVGNVKHFQRNGFPKGLHTGRGSAAMLDRERLMQMAVCLTLHRAGMVPIPAMTATEAAWQEIGPELIKYLARENNERLVIAVDTNGLRSMTISVMNIDSAVRLLQGRSTRSITFHRLDILADRLARSVAKILAT